MYGSYNDLDFIRSSHYKEVLKQVFRDIRKVKGVPE